MTTEPLILLAAGGTGGHLFPAEALGVELIQRGLRVRRATDARALRYSGLFSNDMIDVVPSETVRGRSPVSLARTAFMLGYGTLVAVNLVRRLKPAAVVGFGGYPTVPPLMAAKLLGVTGIVHDANAVLGRANRFLSRRVNAIATSLPGVLDRDPSLAGKTPSVGTPMRPAILVALPGEIDQDQFANAGVLSQAGGALRIAQAEFTPDRLASEISALAAEPARLTAMATAARTVGRLDAAERLADLIVKVAGI